MKFLGEVVGAVEGALNIVNRGKPLEVEVAGGQVVIQTGSPEQREQLRQFLQGLQPGGDKRAALAALYPHTEPKWLNVFLTVSDRLAESVLDDGAISPDEWMGIVFAGIQEAR